MKKLEAIITTMKVEETKEALMNLGVMGVTTTEVRGFGPKTGHREVYRGREYTVNSIAEVKLEIILQDSQLEPALQVLARATESGKIDTGSVIIVPVETAMEHAAR